MIFSVGDEVKHRYMYGKGKVIRIKDNSAYPYVVRFESGIEESFSDYSLVLVDKSKKK